MAYVRIIVDHLRLDYSGLFDPKGLFRAIASFMNERRVQKHENKNFEQDLEDGKAIEWETTYWKKVTDYNRDIYKIRILINKMTKVEAQEGSKRAQIATGNVTITIDAYIEHDYENRWEETPILFFFRTVFDKFIYHGYTEMFEQRLTHHAHQLYHTLEKFFNFYTHYTPVSKVPHFAH